MDLKKKKSVYKGEKTSISWLDITGAGGERKVKGKWKMNDGDPSGSTLSKQFVFCLFWNRQHNGPIFSPKSFQSSIESLLFTLIIEILDVELQSVAIPCIITLRAGASDAEKFSVLFRFNQHGGELGLKLEEVLPKRKLGQWTNGSWRSTKSRCLCLSSRALGHPLGKQLGSTFSLQGRPSTRSIRQPCLNPIVSDTTTFALGFRLVNQLLFDCDLGRFHWKLIWS